MGNIPPATGEREQGTIGRVGPTALAAVLVAAVAAAIGLGGGQAAAAVKDAMCEIGSFHDGACSSAAETTPEPAPVEDPASGAVASLVRLLDVPADEITVVEVDDVTWQDGSLGCAQSGHSYTRAPVAGRRITLRVDGETFQYHASASGRPFYCETPTQ